MSKITAKIPPAGFELVRDQVAAIIASELIGQFVFDYDPDFVVEVLVEDVDPIDKSGFTTVNISLAGGPYDSKDQSASVRGSYQYFIDVFAHSKTTALNTGDFLAAQKIQKILRVIRYVLEDPIYKTLGFKPPFVQRVYISNLEIQNQPGSNDALNTLQGRFILNVVVTETNSLIVPSLIAGFETTVLVGNSNRGYNYQGDNYS